MKVNIEDFIKCEFVQVSFEHDRTEIYLGTFNKSSIDDLIDEAEDILNTLRLVKEELKKGTQDEQTT